jgi:uncharacterized protein YcbK (DUF882 family)
MIVAAAVLAVGGTSRSAATHPAPADPAVPIPDSMRGRSGRLSSRIVRPADAERLRVEPVARVLGEQAFARPAVVPVLDSVTAAPFNFITLVPFEEKERDRVGVYRVGYWPSERGRVRTEAYRSPVGFIEVTEENQDARVSTHFRLRDFLTKDQRDVWPKALVLDMRLIDKLELIVSELRLSGHYVEGLQVLSGFRSPQYNARGLDAGRAQLSRHQYGDAADIFVDMNGDGIMDDLNGDGRSDIRDALYLARVIDRVEARYPDLVGGVGVYRRTSLHGGFVHVDARGEYARWGFE